MKKEDILAKVQEVFRETLDNDEIVLSETTSADDVEEWESLTHVMLVVAIEKEFSIRFGSSEIQSWKNIGELIETIEKKQ